MSLKYDQYLKEHIANVEKGYNCLKKIMPEKFEFEKRLGDKWSIKDHDKSKYSEEEYDAYDKWFYGNKSFSNKVAFNSAWLHHIHNNPHHWQHWILFEDDPGSSENKSTMEEALIVRTMYTGEPLLIQMPDHYIVEMIADWWSFSWKTGNLLEIFNWYENHESTIVLHNETRCKVEEILGRLKVELGKAAMENLK